MTSHLISFATPQYKRSQKQLNASALSFGIDKTHSFTEKDLKKMLFFKENHIILSQKRGFGYWLWKPYLILQVLNLVSPNDIVMYADAGNTVISHLSPLFRLCQTDDIVLFQVHAHPNHTWTKRDAFILMDCDTDFYHNAEQVCGSPILFKNNPTSKKFLEKWLFYCQNPSILTDSPNVCGKPNLRSFQEHRHDQSVLSLLALKQGLTIHRDPSQFGNSFLESYTHSQYQQLLDLHRRKYFTFFQKFLHKLNG